MKGIRTCEDCKYEITLYRFTGRQGFFKVPEKWCEECDMVLRLVKKTVKEQGLEKETNITVKPWWLYWWKTLLRYGSFHPPILVVNGKLISAGIVPQKEALKKVLVSDKQPTTIDIESILAVAGQGLLGRKGGGERV